MVGGRGRPEKTRSCPAVQFQHLYVPRAHARRWGGKLPMQAVDITNNSVVFRRKASAVPAGGLYCFSRHKDEREECSADYPGRCESKLGAFDQPATPR